ncbi:hypothetical protein ACFLYF_04265 [Chloroflexota bacterium]
MAEKAVISNGKKPVDIDAVVNKGFSFLWRAIHIFRKAVEGEV